MYCPNLKSVLNGEIEWLVSHCKWYTHHPIISYFTYTRLYYTYASNIIVVRVYVQTSLNFIDSSPAFYWSSNLWWEIILLPLMRCVKKQKEKNYGWYGLGISEPHTRTHHVVSLWFLTLLYRPFYFTQPHTEWMNRVNERERNRKHDFNREFLNAGKRCCYFIFMLGNGIFISV